MVWEIYYDDESVISSSGIRWHDAPSRGVLFVLETDEIGKRMVHMGMDYYFMRNDSIISCHPLALHEHLLLGIDPGAMKFGRWSPNDVWKRVHGKIFTSSRGR